jgi:hypothetical protein
VGGDTIATQTGSVIWRHRWMSGVDDLPLAEANACPASPVQVLAVFRQGSLTICCDRIEQVLSWKIFIVCDHLDLSTSALTWSGLSLCKHDRGTRNGQRTARVNLKERHPPRGTWQNSFRKRYIRTRQLFRTTSSAVLMSAFQSIFPQQG